MPWRRSTSFDDVTSGWPAPLDVVAVVVVVVSRMKTTTGLFGLACSKQTVEPITTIRLWLTQLPCFYQLIIIMFVNFDWRHNAQTTVTSATQGGTRRYTEGLSSVNCCHTRCTAIDNCTGLTSWALTRWRDQHTSDKVAHYSIDRPRTDKRLSWPSWLTYSGRLSHICGHPSAAGRAWDRESSPLRSTTVPRSQPCR